MGEAIFPPFTVIGGLIHLLFPQNNISEVKVRSAKTILHTVNKIASSEVLQGHNKSTISITKLMRRYPNFMRSSLFPILFLVLVSKDKSGHTGTGVVVVETSKYQYFRRSATEDAYFCLSSNSSLLLLAHSLLPFAVLRSDNFQQLYRPGRGVGYIINNKPKPPPGTAISMFPYLQTVGTIVSVSVSVGVEKEEFESKSSSPSDRDDFQLNQYYHNY